MKRLFKSIALTFLLLLACYQASAANYVKVSDKDGKPTLFALSDRPEVTFSTSELIITTAKETVNYPLTSLLTFELIDNDPTSINNINANQENILFSFGDIIKGSGLAPGSRVSVFTINGQTISNTTVDNNGQASLDLNGQTGIFIIKTESKTFKFTKK